MSSNGQRNKAFHSENCIISITEKNIGRFKVSFERAAIVNNHRVATRA